MKRKYFALKKGNIVCIIKSKYCLIDMHNQHDSFIFPSFREKWIVLIYACMHTLLHYRLHHIWDEITYKTKTVGNEKLAYYLFSVIRRYQDRICIEINELEE